MGATGLVGEVLLGALAARKFPLEALVPLASERSAGRRVAFRGEELEVRPASAAALAGSHLVFFAATGELSRTLAPAAVAGGTIVVDKSATWRLDPAVPLVIPEINGAALARHQGILACPNCTTIAVAMALEPLRRAAGLVRVIATTLQAVSGVGREGLEALVRERGAGPGAPALPSPFPRRIAGDLFPLCGTLGADGTSEEERKLAAETRKILDLPDLELAATCVRVPIEVGHAATLVVETRAPLAVAAARAALAAFPGVRLAGEGELPTPSDAAGRDEVLVGRVRRTGNERQLSLWVVADNLRKGAATNAVQIAEALLGPGGG
ncbi:MAG: aspartate-semialdehyde dehydrogenase [Planctomycetota bacterium]